MSTSARLDALRVGLLAVPAVLLGVVVLATAASVPLWPMVHDPPLLHAIAWHHVEHGLTPYAELWFTSFPGSIALHALIGGVLGWSDLAFQIAGLVFLVGLGAAIVGWLWRTGPLASVLGVGLFGATYLTAGPGMILQRDVVGGGLLLAGGALVVRGGAGWRWAVAGVLAGAAFTIKPQLALGLGVLWLLDVAWERRGLRIHAARAGLAALGALLPVGAAAAWLAALGALPAFLAMVTETLPLHVTLGPGLYTYEPGDWLPVHLQLLPRLGGHGVWAALGVLGILGVWWSRLRPGTPDEAPADAATRRTALATGALALTSLATLPMAGQYFNYHWMPFAMYACLAAALLGARGASRVVALPGAAGLIIAVLLFVRMPTQVLVLAGTPLPIEKDGRVEALADWLRDHTEPGDRVQALDWTAGVLQAMHRAEVVTASPLLYDYMLVLHPDAPHTREVRARTLEILRADPPAWILEVRTPENTLEPEELRALCDGSADADLRHRFTLLRLLKPTILPRRPDRPCPPVEPLPELRAWMNDEYTVVDEVKDVLVWARQP